jgi:hypothetical protein
LGFIDTLGVGWAPLNIRFLLILWVWAGYASIFVFDNTLGLDWVSFNIRFVNTLGILYFNRILSDSLATPKVLTKTNIERYPANTQRIIKNEY